MKSKGMSSFSVEEFAFKRHRKSEETRRSDGQRLVREGGAYRERKVLAGHESGQRDGLLTG